MRFPPEVAQAFGETMPTFTPARVSLPPSPADAFRHELTVRRQDIDPLAHVNNATYVDYFEEALEVAGHGGELETHPRRYRLEYVASAEPGDRLVGSAWEDGLGWCYRLTTADGRELLRARLETRASAWVGG